MFEPLISFMEKEHFLSCVVNGWNKQIQNLLQTGNYNNLINVIHDGSSYLHTAAKFNDPKLIKLLLAFNGKTLNEDDFNDKSLNYSMSWDCVQLLSTVTPKESIFFDFFSQHQFDKIYTILNQVFQSWKDQQTLNISSGWNLQSSLIFINKNRPDILINSKNNKGENLLHLACFHSQDRIVKLLLQLGFDVNHKTKNGWTPLHYASSASSLEICKLLLYCQANSMLEDDQRRTPLFYSKDSQIIHLIKSYRSQELKGIQWISDAHLLKLHKQASFSPLAILGNGIFQIQVFTEQFCNEIIHIHRTSPIWAELYGVKISNTKTLTGLHYFVKKLNKKLIKVHYPKYYPAKLCEASILAFRKREDCETGCALHTDDSNITVNICLYASNLVGSSLQFFSSYRAQSPSCSATFETGSCFIHSGTALHSVTKLESGERINLLLWLKKDKTPAPLHPTFSGFVDLPDKIHFTYLKYLDKLSDIHSLSLTCKKMYELTNTDVVWKKIYFNFFPNNAFDVFSDFKHHTKQRFVGFPVEIKMKKCSISSITDVRQANLLNFIIIREKSLESMNVAKILTNSVVVLDNPFDKKLHVKYRKELSSNIRICVRDFKDWKLSLEQNLIASHDGVIVVYAIHDRNTWFDCLQSFKFYLDYYELEWFPVLLIGIDIGLPRQVSVEEGQFVARCMDCTFHEINLGNEESPNGPIHANLLTFCDMVNYYFTHCTE